MSKFYLYKLTDDSGAAPCVTAGLLSLAICKPMMRKTAKKGDVIFGFAANSLDPENRLIYVAVVDERLVNGDYYRDSKYRRRKDCVYEWLGDKLSWRPESKYHDSGSIPRDLGNYPVYDRAKVLLSRDFRYFGANGKADYKRRFPRIAHAVERLTQGHRVHHTDPRLVEELRLLKNQVWTQTSKRVLGKPMSVPQQRESRTRRSC